MHWILVVGLLALGLAGWGVGGDLLGPTISALGGCLVGGYLAIIVWRAV